MQAGLEIYKNQARFFDFMVISGSFFASWLSVEFIILVRGHKCFIVRLKFQKRSALEFVSRSESQISEA